MRQIKRTAVVLAVLSLLAFVLVACHTVEGAGKDIEDAGQGIQDAVD